MNVGMYVFLFKSFKHFKKKYKIDMDELIHKILKKNFRVGVFSINENAWIDTGTLKNITLKDFN